MENIILYIVIAVLVIAIIAYFVIQGLKIWKMSPEERRKTLITYLQGIVALVEKEIGSGHGAEKLKEAEEYFKRTAPMIYKILLSIVGKDTLSGLIEEALKNVKEGFAK